MHDDQSWVRLSSERVVAGIWRNLFMAHWRARGTAGDVELLLEIKRDFIRRVPGQLVTCSVVPAAVVGPISDDLRKAVDRETAETHPRTRAAVVVLLGSGFGGAILRSLLTGMNMISRVGFPNKVVDSVAAGCSFVAPYVDGRPAPAEIEGAYRALVDTPPR